LVRHVVSGSHGVLSIFLLVHSLVSVHQGVGCVCMFSVRVLLLDLHQGMLSYQ
jgi:hypothetical protein